MSLLKEWTYSIGVFLYLTTHAPEPKNHHYDPWNQLNKGSTGKMFDEITVEE